MAAPIAHIFLAVQMLLGPFKGLFNEIEFIIGTSFPDIRYLKVVERTETHFFNVTLYDILQEKDSFKAGMMFHSFVDEQREAYIVKHNFYEIIPNFRFRTQALKFAEDEILKGMFDISRYSVYFNEILDQEKSWNIDEIHIKNWHLFLKEYFNGAYSGKDLMMKYFDLNEPEAWFIKRWIFSWFYARKINKTMSLIINNKQAKNLILDFYITVGDNYK